MKFTTQSGSVYEIDLIAKKIRRLNGKADPTPRMSKDGAWRTYQSTYPDPIQIGSRVVIVWGEEVEPLPETKLEDGAICIPMTTTSVIVDIDETVYN